MAELKFLTNIKNKWGITSNWQVLIICIVFAITGSSSIRIGSPVLELLGITPDMNPWAYWPLRILIIFPIYQILLVVFGTIFGQFKFFWNVEKKMFGRFIRSKNIDSVK